MSDGAPIGEARAAALHALESRLGHTFSDLTLLDRALTHTSLANEDVSGTRRHNEPFEFLGDSVLGFLVAEMLHRNDPEGDEGTKSRARAHLVAASSLYGRAMSLGLPDLLLLGRGEEKTGGRKKAALSADAYEAVVAAIYLDGGLPAASAFVAREFGEFLERGVEDLAERDHKSALQEYLQGRGAPPPEYRVVAEEGPDHRRRFRVEAVVDGRALAEGEGFSKKQAQQEAARRALEALAVSPGEEG